MKIWAINAILAVALILSINHLRTVESKSSYAYGIIVDAKDEARAWLDCTGDCQDVFTLDQLVTRRDGQDTSTLSTPGGEI